MDSHALAVIEFPALLAELSSLAQTAPGGARLRALQPTHAIEEIVERRRPYQDTMRLLSSGCTPPGLAFDDIGDILRQLAPAGAAVGGDELVRCRRLLDTCADAKAFLLGEACRELRVLSAWGEALHDAPEVRRALHQALDDDGTVLDSASPRLAELRRRSRALERRLQETLDDMTRASEFESVIRDRFVTVRNGRFVVPVRREQRNALPGVVHDHSNSGQTIFVEPTATLPMGNELADARLQERDEVLRILHELSALVRGLIPALRSNSEVLSELDAALAVGRWAVRDGCQMPRFGTRLALRRGRHPLLEKQLRSEGRANQLVPLNLSLDKGTRVLVVTGSNTGGKTVVLKTVGLLTAAAQCGLPVPVGDGTELELFEQIFADIGDEQSLAASLSTFSGHLKQIGRILAGAGKGRSLVLLDELGAGTDPLEGGALACAVLDTLAQRNALTLTTTHLGVVKTFAHDRQHMVNAAVAFDVETLQPEYTLEVGRPGASHALQIARRLRASPRGDGPGRGLPLFRPPPTRKHARHHRGGPAAHRRPGAGGGRRPRTHGPRPRRHPQGTRRTPRRTPQDAPRRLPGGGWHRRQHSPRDGRGSAPVPPPDERHGAGGKGRERGPANGSAPRPANSPQGPSERPRKPGKPVKPEGIQVGDTVSVPRLNGKGKVLEVLDNGKRVAIDVSGLRFTVAVNELEATAGAAKPEPTQVKVSRPRVAGQTTTELVLVGSRVDEALDRLDLFLNQAMLANIEEVRVVHGFGTGALRRGVHDWLRQQRSVAGFRLGKHQEDPGGAGVTIVRLR